MITRTVTYLSIVLLSNLGIAEGSNTTGEKKPNNSKPTAEAIVVDYTDSTRNPVTFTIVDSPVLVLGARDESGNLILLDEGTLTAQGNVFVAGDEEALEVGEWLLDDDVLLDGVIKNDGHLTVALFVLGTGELVDLPPCDSAQIILYRGCGVSCQTGYYSCCNTYPATSCICVVNSETAPCTAGGKGSSGCSIEAP